MIVARKDRTIRYFDFTQRYLPDEILNSGDMNQTLEDYHDWHLKRRINSVDFSGTNEVTRCLAFRILRQPRETLLSKGWKMQLKSIRF